MLYRSFAVSARRPGYGAQPIIHAGCSASINNFKTPMTISQDALDTLFNNARTANGFLDKAVDPALLRRAYEIASMGPTSMNTQPTRYVFLNTMAARERLLPAMSAGNLDKTRSAPVTVIVATDTRFHEFMPQVWHNPGAQENFEANAALRTATATRNGTLGGAYFIIAARAVGLDCGPMSGVDLNKVNSEFFPDGRWQANFLINLGYGDNSKLFKRNARLSFEQACQVL
jgi:3-hydroxypropanoate dehydrogenase